MSTDPAPLPALAFAGPVPASPFPAPVHFGPFVYRWVGGDVGWVLGRPGEQFGSHGWLLYKRLSSGAPAARLAGLVTCPEAAAYSDALARFARHGVVRPPTRVCSVRGLDAAGAEARGVVYVGRTHRRRDGLSSRAGVVVFGGSPLANPFKVAPKAPAEARRVCVARYREHLRGRPELVALAKTLSGRLLGCWCGEWDGCGEPGFECHAVEVARLADE